MSGQPYIPFYVGDWRKDPGVRALSYEERGAWVELLFLMHESERRGFLTLNGQAMDDKTIGKLLGIHGNKWRKIKRNLQEKCVFSVEKETGIIFSRRMVRDEEISKKRSKSGKLGGNPAFEKGKANPYYDKQTDKQKDKQTDKRLYNPSSSSLPSSSSPSCINTPTSSSVAGATPNGQEQGVLGEEFTLTAKPSEPDLTVEEIRTRWNTISGVKRCLRIQGPLVDQLNKLRSKNKDKAWWDELFDIVSNSPFLRGKIPSQQEGRESFRCTLSWAIQPLHLSKILAGDYKRIMLRKEHMHENMG